MTFCKRSIIEKIQFENLLNTRMSRQFLIKHI